MGLGYRGNRGTKAKNPTILVPSLKPDNDKWCYKCKQYKSAETCFSGDASRWDKLTAICKECSNKIRVERRRKAKIDNMKIRA